MTRFGFLLFNLLLVGLIYLLVYMNSMNANDANAAARKAASISYVLRNFSIPYIMLILVMVLISTVRWFMNHDPDIAREIGSWANALWIVPAITILALYLLGSLQGNFWHDLHDLMTLR